jgi:hypothetical protein
MLVRNVLKWDYNYRIGLFLFFQILYSLLLSQKTVENKTINSTQHSFFFTQSFQKFDNFSTLNWLVQRNKFSLCTSVGIGVNRTFFQDRIFPQLQMSFGHKSFSFKNGSISPEINSLLSSFSTIERHYFSSIQVGYLFQFGKTLYFIHRLNAGLLNEKFKNSIGNVTSANTLAWQFSLGIGYAIN